MYTHERVCVCVCALAAFSGWKPWISIHLSLILLRIPISLLLLLPWLLLRWCVEVRLCCLIAKTWSQWKPPKFTLSWTVRCINRIVIIDNDDDDADGDHDDGDDDDDKLRWSFYYMWIALRSCMTSLQCVLRELPFGSCSVASTRLPARYGKFSRSIATERINCALSALLFKV